MSLFEVKVNTECVVKSITISDTKIKIHIMELGLVEGTRIEVKKKSGLKNNLLISFNSSCFTINEEVARGIQVNYV